MKEAQGQILYQRIFPQCRTALGLPDDPHIAGINAELVGSPLPANLDVKNRPDLVLREIPEPELDADTLQLIGEEQASKLAALIQEGVLPEYYADPLKIIRVKSEGRISEANLYRRRANFFLHCISGRGYPLSVDGSDKRVVTPPDATPFVLRFISDPGALNVLESWGTGFYDRIRERYERQAEVLGELILPFQWFFHDLYSYRGVNWIQGLPDADQSDIADYETLTDIVLPSSLIFRLGSPYPFQAEEHA